MKRRDLAGWLAIAPIVAGASDGGRIEGLGPVASVHVPAREVRVWLPPGYAGSAPRRYPVLYLHDGQNLFDRSPSGPGWGVDRSAAELIIGGRIEPGIIVAVGNTPSRIDEYTPAAMMREGRMMGGGASRYARFLIDELKPRIDRRYRTRRAAASTAVGGSSLGALVSLWLVLNEGAHFGAGLIVSPSVWWAGEAILNDVERWTLRGPRPRLWVSIGSREGSQAVDGADRLARALHGQGWRGTGPGSPRQPSLVWRNVEAAGHDEASWAAQFPDMLRFLWPRRR